MDVVLLGVLETYIQKTLVGMGALKGAPCEVQGTHDEGDGTQTLTLKWKDTDGVIHTTDISLPSAIFKITSPSNGQTLRYNSVSGKFENSNVSFSADLEDLDNVVITSVQDRQVLTYDAANNRWINADGSVVAALNDLTDVVITTAQNGQVLTYDATAQKWLNTTLEISASDVDYDNTTSGLTATDVQGAIDEIKLDISQLSASKIGYDGTASGLTANKVQGAIDELASEKVDKETGKGLSANDFTDTLKNKLDGIEENAEENDIDTIKVNGTALTPQNKAIDILLNMTKLSDVDLTGLADEMILIYDAANNKWYAGANTGATYTAGEGIEIDQNNVISSKMVLFTGTEAQWNALPLVDKIKFTHYATNDDQTGQIDPVPTQNSNNLMTSGGIYTALQNKADVSDITDAIEALDVTDAAVAGSYVTEVSEADGKISVVREAADASPTSTSNKMVKSGGVFTSEQDIYKYNGVMGAKNLLENTGADTTTIRDVTFTKNVDGSVTANGTQDGTGGGSYYHVSDTFTIESGTYKLTGCPSGGSSIKYRVYVYDHTSGSTGEVANASDIGDGATFNLQSGHEYNINIMIGTSQTVNDLVFHPMIRYASDTDSTYQPYAKTNKELTEDSVDWDNFSELGAVNFFDNTAPDKSQNGAVYTLNADKSETISAATYPTTVSANASTYCTVTLPKGTYRLSGCPSGGSDSTYRLSLTGIATSAIFDYGDGVVFTISEEKTGTLYFDARANWVITEPVTFYPMITPVSYKGSYVPYAMTNQQLTERMSAPKVFIPTGSAVDSYTAGRCRCARLGAYTLIQFHLTLKSTATSGTAADIIKASDIGLNSWGYTQFALGYGTNSSTVRIVANENTNRIQLESNVGTFPAGHPVYGQILVYGE